MSIVINIRYSGTGGAARAFVEEMTLTGTLEAIRAEEGNLRYEYFTSLEDPETVLLVDAWEDQAALDHHHASPMMDTIVRLRDTYDLHMHVERFTSDEVPSKDSEFIRE